MMLIWFSLPVAVINIWMIISFFWKGFNMDIMGIFNSAKAQTTSKLAKGEKNLITKKDHFYGSLFILMQEWIRNSIIFKQH